MTVKILVPAFLGAILFIMVLAYAERPLHAPF